MSTYTITQTLPSTEEGYVYADVLINDETEPRRLILPEVPEDAQAKLEEYLGLPENQPVDAKAKSVAEETPLDVLIDQTIEV